MSKKIAIMAENMYEDLELWYPYYRFKEAGYDTVIVGSGSSGEFTSKHGYPVKPHTTADQISADDFDAIIVPGGFSPDYMRRSESMVKFAKDMNDQGKICAAICHGLWLLISAGAVGGKKATSFFSIKDDMINAGANWVDEEVVIDGNLISSRKPDDLPAFCRAILAKL